MVGHLEMYNPPVVTDLSVPAVRVIAEFVSDEDLEGVEYVLVTHKGEILTDMQMSNRMFDFIE
jgi:hypothetical protein